MGAPQFEQAGADISGTGTTNTIPRWTGPSTLGDSVLVQSGTSIGVNVTPAQTLHAYFASGNNGIRIESGTNAASDFAVLRFTQGGGEKAVLYTNLTQTVLKASAGTLDLWGSGSSGIRVDTSGNVGIGTTSPDARLQVIGASGNAALRIGFNNISQNYYDAGDHFFRSSGGSLTRWQINTSGHFIAGADNSYDIGASGATRPRTVYVGTSIGIGANPTATRALTTVADLDVFGLLIGRGPGASTTNTVVGGAGAALSLTTGTSNTAIGAASQAATTTGSRNTTIGEGTGYTIQTSNDNTHVGRFAGTYHSGSSNTAVGSGALTGASGLSGGTNNTAIGAFASQANTTGAVNVGVGFQALLSNTSGASNVAVGAYALGTTNGGSSNIALGREATTAAAGDSNQFVLGSATYYVATNGGATTYYATAGALLGYMQIRLNGANVKIPVYAP